MYTLYYKLIVYVVCVQQLIAHDKVYGDEQMW